MIHLRHDVTKSSKFCLILVTFLVSEGRRVTGLPLFLLVTSKEENKRQKARLLWHPESLGSHNSHIGIIRAGGSQSVVKEVTMESRKRK